jgi:hypothetical protein
MHQWERRRRSRASGPPGSRDRRPSTPARETRRSQDQTGWPEEKMSSHGELTTFIDRRGWSEPAQSRGPIPQAPTRRSRFEDADRYEHFAAGARQAVN